MAIVAGTPLRAKACDAPPLRSRQNHDLVRRRISRPSQIHRRCAPASASTMSYCRARRPCYVGHLRFRYLDWGNEGLRPLLFLHGGALTAHTWDLCCLALRDEFHCLALDQRGHGDTDWAPDADYSIAAQREDVKGFVDAARPRPFHPRRHVDGRDQCARLCDPLPGAALRLWC